MDNQELINAFAVALKQAGVGNQSNKAYGYKAPGTTGDPSHFHGPGGMFGMAGLDNQVISARITPRGISAVLPVFPSVDTNPLFPFITGIEEDAGDEPTTPCATCLSGEYEACIQTAVFGRICRESPTIDVDKVMERVNSGEVDLELVNDILGFPNDNMAAIRGYDRGQLLQVASAQGMLLVGMFLQQKLVPMWWQGNPANNIGVAPNYGYAECPGLDMLISTGKIDAITGTACGALDSDVKEFAYNNINTLNAGGGYMIVQYLSQMAWYLQYNATHMGLAPCTWALVMNAEAWYELTEIWPVAWLSTRNITLGAGNTNNIDSSRVAEMRDQMRASMTIMINGLSYQVVVDSGILTYDSTNDANLAAGEFACNFYFVPLRYMGSRAGTFIQYKDYRGAQQDINMARLERDIWTDDGRFMWTVERLKWCFTMSGKVEPRILLKVPQLAGRINHIMYTPLQNLRSWDQDSEYFLKGGVDHRAQPAYYSEWNAQGR